MADDVASIGVKMETDDVARGIKSLEALAQQGPKVEKAMAGVEGAAAKTGKSLKSIAEGSGKGLEEIGKAAPKAADGVGRVAKSADDAKRALSAISSSSSALSSVSASAAQAASGIAGFGTGVKSAQRVMQEMQSQALSAAQAMAQMNTTMTASVASMQSMAKAQADAAKNAADMGRIFKEAGEHARGAGSGVKATATAATDAGSAFSVAAAGVKAFMGLQIIGWAKDSSVALYQASAAAERLKIGLDFASARGGAEEIAYLRKTTYDLGLSFQSTAQAYMQFQAASKGTSIEGDKARAVFESISKASAVMGLTAEQSSGALLALQQMVSKGTVSSEELRGQLGERLPGAFQIAARSMGVTTSELGKMLEQGQIIADEFLPKFAAELEKSLGDAPEKAAQRLDASVNRMNDAWDRMKQNAGDSGISQFWSGQINILNDAMGNFNNKVEAARAAGAGFGGQMLAAAGATAEFLNPVNAIGYAALETGNKLKEAEKKLLELKDAGAQQSSNLMLREAFNHAQRLVDKLREAKSAQDAVAGAAVAPTGGDPYNSGSQYGSYLEDQKNIAAAEKALAEVRMRAAGVNKQYFTDLATWQNGLKTGVLTEKQYAAGVSELAKTTWDASKAGKEAADAARKGASASKAAAAGVRAEQSAYASLMATVKAKIAANDAELFAAGKLTESTKLRIQLQEQLDSGSKKLTAAHKANIKEQIEKLSSQEKEEKAIKRAIALNDERIASDEELAKGMADLDNRVNATRLAMHDYEQSIKDTVEMTNLEVSTLGMNSVARQTLIEQLRIEHEWRDKIQKIKDAPWKTDEERQTAVAEAEAMKLKLKANAQTKAYISEWEKAYDQTSQALTDALMRGGQNAGEYLKDYFRTLVLRPVIQAVMAPVAGAVTNMMQGGGGVGGGGMGGTLNTGMNAYKAFSNSQMFSDFGTYAGMNINGVGTKMFEMGMESAGESLMDFGVSVAEYADVINVAGDVLGYGKALYDLSQGKYGSAVGTAVGTYFGGPIGAAIGSAIGGWIDSSTASRGANHSGAAFSTSMAGNNAAAGQIFGSTQGDWYGDVTKRYSAGVEAKLAVSVSAMAGVYNSLTNYAGETSRKIDLLGAFVANGVHQDEDAYGYGQVRDKLSGEILGAFTNRELGTDTDAAFKAYMGQMGGLIVEQLKASDIPGWMKQQLNAIDGEVTIEGLQAALNQIAAIDTGFKVLGQTMGMFNGMSAETQTALLNISGGMEGLNTNAGAYYQGFYDETERMEILSGNLRKALGGLDLSIDPAMGNDAKEQYRKAVEDAFAAGNGQVAASLLALSGNFATAADYAQKAAEESSQAIIEAAQESAQAMAELATNLRSSLIGLESRFGGGGLSAQYQSQDAAAALQSLFEGIGISKNADDLSRIILGATPEEVEQNFRTMWGMLDSDAAKQQLVDVTGAMLDIADASKVAADATNALLDQIKQYRESLAGTIEGFYLGTLSGQGKVDYLGAKESGLWAELNATDDPVAVAQKLQQTIIDRIQAEADLRFKLDETTRASLQEQLSVAQAIASAVESMQSARDSLALGNTSALNPYAQLQYAGGKFDEAYAKALAGDSGAWKDVQSFGQNYVQLGRDNYASSGGAADIYFKVTEAMDRLIADGMGASEQVDSLQAQIDATQKVADNTEQTLWVNQQSYDTLSRLDAVMATQQAKAEAQGAETNALLKEQNAKLQQTVEQNQAAMSQQAAMAAQAQQEMQLLRAELADLKATVRSQAKQGIPA